VFRALLTRKSMAMVYSAENILNNIRPAFHASTKYVVKRANLAFVCSHGVKDVLQQEGFPAPIEVFPLGVDTTRFYKFSAEHLKQQLKLDGKFVLGYVGRLYTFKGVFLLLELMRKLPKHVHLLIIGSGPEEQALLQRAESYNIKDRVHFRGNIAYKELPDYMNCMNVGIVPSLTTKRWKEQFGRAIIELMSCEVPVIASASGSIPEVIGDAGHLIDEADVQQLHSSVRILMNSPEKSTLAGKKGRERVLSLYSIHVMGEQFLAMYHNLMLQQGYQGR
jgi:glycosyltransferase involved in cell wall biosynthesis